MADNIGPWSCQSPNKVSPLKEVELHVGSRPTTSETQRDRSATLSWKLCIS